MEISLDGNYLLLIRKQILLNSLNNIINSNKNFFESHKFNLVNNRQSTTNLNASSFSSINFESGSFYKLPCWLVEDCLIDVKADATQYENYLTIQKLIRLIKQYFFNLIDRENKELDFYKRLNRVNEIITEEESGISSEKFNNLNLDNDNENSYIKNYASCIVKDLIQNLSTQDLINQTQSDTNLELKKLDSFASNLLNDLFNDTTFNISNNKVIDDSKESKKLIIDKSTPELESLLNRRHSADLSMPSRLSLLHLKEERNKSASSTDSISDLSTKRNSRFASLTTSHNIENDLIIRRHSFNPSDLNRRICLSQLANKTVERFNSFSRNHFRISFPTCKLNKPKSKAFGYANSDSNLNILDESNKMVPVSSFKQYNKVVIKSILRKSDCKPIYSSCRTNATNSDLNVSNTKMNLIANSSYLKDLVDKILDESFNEIKLVTQMNQSIYTNELNQTLFKEAYDELIRLNLAYKKNQPYLFKCNCNSADENDLSCLLTIYCMMIAIGELNLKNQITIVCSHFGQTF